MANCGARGYDSGRAADLPGRRYGATLQPTNEEHRPMKKTHLLRSLILILICALVGIGFYRGWFAVSSQREPETEKLDLNLRVDTKKIKDDTKKAAEKTKEEASELSAKVKEEAKKLKNQ